MLQVDDDAGWVLTPSSAARTPVAITSRELRQWTERAAQVARVQDAIEAFAAFADVEDAFEPIEAKVQQALIAIDREVQMQVDIARGK